MGYAKCSCKMILKWSKTENRLFRDMLSKRWLCRSVHVAALALWSILASCTLYGLVSLCQFTVLVQQWGRRRERWRNACAFAHFVVLWDCCFCVFVFFCRFSPPRFLQPLKTQLVVSTCRLFTKRKKNRRRKINALWQTFAGCSG